MIKNYISDGSGTKRQAFVDDQNALIVSMASSPPMIKQKSVMFKQYLSCTHHTPAHTDMRSAILVNRTDGVCADHTGPTYTFTSASGGMLGAQQIHITDAGATAHGVVGYYKVHSINSATSIELYEDPTDGTNETGIDFHQETSEFSVISHETRDRYITQVSFLLADASAVLNKFGNVTALTTGCNFEYIYGTGETITIYGALKSNWDFVRMCCGNPSFGATTNAFIASNVSGTSEGIIPVLDFTKIIPPYGLCIEAGTDQRLLLRINDDTSGVDAFDAIAYGFERLP